MEPFRIVRGTAAPLLLDSIDTDVITPQKRMMEGIDAMVKFAFEPIRYRANGSVDPDCALNQEAYRGAAILLAGRNFGCGSSRETAVWAIAGLGFRCVIAPSFGDIFYTNCFKNGMLPVVLPLEEVRALAAEACPPGEAPAEIVVDLESQTITTPRGRELTFSVHPFRREGLLAGADDIELTLRRREQIDAFQNEDRKRRAWIY